MDSFLNLLLTFLVASICLASGRGISGWLRFQFASRSEELTVSTGFGFGILIYAMVILGVTDTYRSDVAWGLLSVLAILGFISSRRALHLSDIRRLLPRLYQLPPTLLALLAVLCVYSSVYLIVALTPTLEGDSLAGYLLTAREYARQGGLVSVDYAYTDTYPANGQMISTFGFLLRGQILAQLLLVWLMGILSLATIYSIGRTWLSRRAALVAVVIWYGSSSVGYLASSGKIDLAWAAFEILALLAFARWYFAPLGHADLRWLGTAGFFLGLSGGVKQASGFATVILLIAIALRLWRNRARPRGEWWRSYAVFCLPVALSGLWVLRTYIMSGTLAFTGENLRGATHIAGLLHTLWDMSMLGNASSLEGPLGKSIGPTILATLPLLFAFRSVERRVWHVLVFCCLILILWFNGVQRARHLLPTVAFLSLISGYVINQLLRGRPWIGRTVVILTVTSLCLNLGTWVYTNIISLQRIPYVLGLQDMDSYLAANLSKSSWLPNHSIVTYAREHLPTDVKIASLSVGGHDYYVERPIYSAWNQTPREFANPDSFVRELRSSGITHMYINTFAINMHELQDAWLAQPEFQTRYMDKLICSDGQCLYAFQQY